MQTFNLDSLAGGRAAFNTQRPALEARKVRRLTKTAPFGRGSVKVADAFGSESGMFVVSDALILEDEFCAELDDARGVQS